MGVEIERKFLVENEDWKVHVKEATGMCQGYISAQADSTVRVRLTKGPGGAEAWLTIKGRGQGLKRPEFEYPIPLEDAAEMLTLLCEGRRLEKTRHLVPWQGHLWEIDVFEGDNAGLVLAEIELDDEEEDFVAPPWLGREVTGDVRYYNARLVEAPYRSWAMRDD